MDFLLDGLQRALEMIAALDPRVIGPALVTLTVTCTAVGAAALVGVPAGGALAVRKVPGRTALVLLARMGMAVPTVLIGLLVYGVLSRRGPLGPAELLFTKRAIIAGEFLLALPIIISLTHGGVAALDRRAAETARTLGAGEWRTLLTCLGEARRAVLLAILTAFARCVTELGIAVMVGGNLKGRTRTLTTGIALETSKGDFETGVALGLILLAVAALMMLAILRLSGEMGGRRRREGSR